MDRQVVFQALSTLLGASVIPLSKHGKTDRTQHLELDRTQHLELDHTLTVKTFLPEVFDEEARGKRKSICTDTPLRGGLFIFGDNSNSTQTSEQPKGKSTCTYTRKELFIDKDEFFDPKYDFDFRNLTDSSPCQRGNEPYERPIGWNRFALKVEGKYDDDVWLGEGGWRSESSDGEWPVSFHGTSYEGAKGIIKSELKAGPGKVYGRGVYSTPNIVVAGEYAQTFKFEQKTYKVLLQNRINPERRKKCKNVEDYWLVPVPEDASEEKQKEIVTSAIRPYGILIREI